MNKLLLAISLTSAAHAVELAIDDPFVEINVETPEGYVQTTTPEEADTTVEVEEDTVVDETEPVIRPDMTGYWDLTYYEQDPANVDQFYSITDTYYMEFIDDMSVEIDQVALTWGWIDDGLIAFDSAAFPQKYYAVTDDTGAAVKLVEIPDEEDTFPTEILTRSADVDLINAAQ